MGGGRHIGTNAVDFGPDTTPAIKWYAIDGQSIFDSGGALANGSSVGLWA